MGITERKLREKEERRDLILRKAKELVIESGVESLTMQQIADGAELSKATLYLYFESKEAILLAILWEAADTFDRYVRERVKPGASGLEAIRALWSAYLAFFAEAEELFLHIGIGSYVNPIPLLSGEADGLSEGWPMRRMTELVAEVLRRGVEDGTLESSISPLKTASTILAVAVSVIDQIARHPRKARDPERVSDLLHDTFEILLRGLAAPGADRGLLTLPKG